MVNRPRSQPLRDCLALLATLADLAGWLAAAAARLHLSINLTINLASVHQSRITPFAHASSNFSTARDCARSTEPRCAIQSVYDLSSTKPPQIGIVYRKNGRSLSSVHASVVPSCKRNREPMYADQ